MIHRYSLLFVLPLLLAVSVIFKQSQTTKTSGHPSAQTVNAVIGDESFIAQFGEKPGPNVSDKLRIKTHLQYVEQKLRARSTDHLSPSQRKNRSHYLDLLREYIRAEAFPHNDGHPDARRPAFIDIDGNICAVGYLVEQTRGRAVAEALNSKYKYAFIPEIDDPIFKKWVNESGFTIKELAMIQPMYGPPPPEERVETTNSNHVERSYGIGTTLLLSANALYFTNKSENPWLFNKPQINHWFGLMSGAGSIVLGTLNLDNTQTDTDTICGFGSCWETTRKRTNDLRSGISMANIGVGLVNVVRSLHHLLRNDQPEPRQFSKTQLNVTHLSTPSMSVGESVPALKFNYRF